MPIETVERVLGDVLIITPKRFGDERGLFCETYSAKDLASHGVETTFVQDNHAYSGEINTIRGLHFQAPPAAQAKLLRVTRGAVLDVVVDIRPDSATFGQHASIELSAENWRQVFVPRGFAHGYRTLTPESVVIYKVDGFYSREHEGGLQWNDPRLAIDWQIGDETPIVNERDASWPRFEGFTSPF